MSESKPHQFRPPLYNDEPARTGSSVPRSGSEGRREQQGWDAYRKWLKSMNTKPQTRRSTADQSIYSWKGYNSWADRIRQSWKSEED
jgi:hypothetical protein